MWGNRKLWPILKRKSNECRLILRWPRH
jgi:hypothetical protein